MVKKFFFKGKNLEELEKLSVDEFIKLIPSHSRRTLKRMGHQVKKFLQKFRAYKAMESGGQSGQGSPKPFRTHFRQMVVLPEMIGSRIQVYDGKTFVDVNVIPEMLGHKLGEYSIPIKLVRHSGPGIGATRGSKAVELK